MGPGRPHFDRVSPRLGLGLIESDHELAVTRQRFALNVEALAILVREGDANPDPFGLLLLLPVHVCVHDEHAVATGFLGGGLLFLAHDAISGWL